MAKTNGKTNGGDGANHPVDNPAGGANGDDPKPTKPKSGGKRKGAGRPANSPNKINRHLRELANEYTDEALRQMVSIMRGKFERQEINPETNRPRKIKVPVEAATALVAAEKILDRGHGRPRQMVDHHQKPIDLSQLTDEELAEYYRISCKLNGVEPNTVPGPFVDGVAPPPGTSSEGGDRTIN
jgi:hypothetical protein